jgi:Uma2 family endonuclease
MMGLPVRFWPRGPPKGRIAQANNPTELPSGENDMNLIVPAAPPGAIVYPDDDGLPLSDNTKQLRWIVMLYGNLCALFRTVADVFVAGNHLWYPVEGHPEICNAPDVLVVFGRPKGDRGSYQQWLEGGVPVTVAFEILSPNSTATALAIKFAFYEDYGVEEYYIYDPESNRLYIFVRRGEVLVRVREVDSFVSPRLGIRFDLSGSEMVVLGPNGKRFLSFEELQEERQAAEQRAEQAQQQAEQARQQAEQAQQRVADLQRRADRQAALMRRVLAQQATPAELQELQQLLEPSPSTST